MQIRMHAHTHMNTYAHNARTHYALTRAVQCVTLTLTLTLKLYVDNNSTKPVITF